MYVLGSFQTSATSMHGGSEQVIEKEQSRRWPRRKSSQYHRRSSQVSLQLLRNFARPSPGRSRSVASFGSQSLAESRCRDKAPRDELSSLSKKEVAALVKARPHLSYDLPFRLRNDAYFVNFDMDVARSRFIVRHRWANCSFLDLPINDKVRLLEVALGFVQRLGLHDSFLTLPSGKENMAGIAYPTFYAFIVVRSIDQYIHLFRTASDEHTLLAWPLIKKWKTCFWLPDTLSYQSINIFLESVRFNSSVYFSNEFGIMTRRRMLEATKSATNDSQNTGMMTNFSLDACEEKGFIGVRCSSFPTYSSDPVSRWQILQFMEEKVQDWMTQMKADLKCWLSVPLMFEFQLTGKGRVEGLIRFPEGLPVFLRTSKKEEKKKVKVKTRLLGAGQNLIHFGETCIDILEEEWICIDLMRRVENPIFQASFDNEKNDDCMSPPSVHCRFERVGVGLPRPRPRKQCPSLTEVNL